MSDIPVVKVNMFCPSRELNDIRRYYKTGNIGKYINCSRYASDWDSYCWKNFRLSLG